MIKFRNIHKAYGDKQVFDGLDVTIEIGEFVTVVGTSGSGKTTLMKLVNGLIQPDSGQVLIDGKDIQDENLIALRRKIGYVIQGNVLFPHLTVAENISYVLDLEKEPILDKDEKIAEKLALLSLPEELHDRYPSELSGGQAQRVGIARALISEPNILLMDEPFGAVDAITRYQMQHELKKIHQEMKPTIIFVTHDIAEALTLGDRVLVLDDGQVQQFASPEEIRKQPETSFVHNLLAIAGELDG